MRFDLVILFDFNQHRDRFRWVFCQLDRLRRCLSPRIRQALDELPDTLDETYERTLLDIDEENWAYAHRLFQCIVVARRPLRVEELAEFLAFKLGTGGSLTFQNDWRPENPRDTVMSTCSSLVAIVYVGGSAVMQFSHFSVKEYLTSSRIAESRVSRYYIPLEPAHLFVTQACLSLLLQLDKQTTRKSIKELPLARYAGQHWADHAEFGNVSSHTDDLIKCLFNPSPKNHHFANWVWIYDTISDKSTNSEVPSRPRSFPLHYAAQHGFHRVAEWLITTCSQDVNVFNADSLTAPLHIASREGRFTVVQVLLKHGAYVNVVYGNGFTPLHLASQFEHPEVARLLLENGADVNSETLLNITPLCLLSEGSGDMEVAQVLLEYGADPNALTYQGCTPLYMALQNGQDLTQLLLEHGADPNVRDVDGQTLLHVSSRRGNLEVTQRLLELGADVNSCDYTGQTPFLMAAQTGGGEVMQLLLQHGAERNVTPASRRHRKRKAGASPNF